MSRLVGKQLLVLSVLVALGGGSVQNISAQNILVGDVRSNSILQYSTTGAYLGVFASGNGLSVPYGMAYGPDGNLYVCSEGNNSILEFNGQSGAFIKTFTSGGAGGLTYPNDIAFGPDGKMYVSSFNGNAVYKFEMNGTADGRFATAPGLQGATGLAFNQNSDGTTSLYVSSSGTGQIFQFNASTGALIGGGAYINDPSHLFGTAGFVFNPANGYLYATSFLNSPVSGTTNANPGSQLVQENTSNFPANVASNSGTIFSSSSRFNNAAPSDVILDSSGNNFLVSLYNSGTIFRVNTLTGTSSSRPFITLPTDSQGNHGLPLYMVLTQPAVSGVSAFSSAAAVPEPTSFILLGLGGAGLAVMSVVKRRRCLAKSAL